MNRREEIYKLIDEEREHQWSLFGYKGDEHELATWLHIIQNRLRCADKCWSVINDNDECVAQLLKLAAVIIACLEQYYNVLLQGYKHTNADSGNTAADHGFLQFLDFSGDVSDLRYAEESVPPDEHIYSSSGMWSSEIEWKDTQDKDGVLQFVSCMTKGEESFRKLLRDLGDARDEIDLLTKQKNILTEDCVRLGKKNKELKKDIVRLHDEIRLYYDNN